MARDPYTSTIASAGGRGAFARWFAFLGGAVAWTLHLLLAWAIAEFGCIRGLHHTQLAGVTLTGWLILALTLVSFAVAVAATWVGYRPYGEHRREAERPRDPADFADKPDGEHADPRAEAADYLLRCGFIASALFAIIILGQALPLVFYLQRC